MEVQCLDKTRPALSDKVKKIYVAIISKKQKIQCFVPVFVFHCISSLILSWKYTKKQYIKRTVYSITSFYIFSKFQFYFLENSFKQQWWTSFTFLIFVKSIRARWAAWEAFAKFLPMNPSLPTWFREWSQRPFKPSFILWTCINQNTSRARICSKTKTLSKMVNYRGSGFKNLGRITVMVMLFGQKYFSIKLWSWSHFKDLPSIFFLLCCWPIFSAKILNLPKFTICREEFCS